MSRTRRSVLRGIGTAAGAALIAGCAAAPGATTPPTATETPTRTPTRATTGTPDDGDGTTIDMVTGEGEFFFDPVGLFVDPGTTVTWRVESGSHSTTAYEEGNSSATVTRIPDGATAWNSGVLSGAGGTFEYAFEVEGTYDYFCIPHKTLGMVGRVVVGEPGGPAEGSMPPDGTVPGSGTIVEQGAVPYDEFSG